MLSWLRTAICLAILFLVAPALAFEVDKPLPDPAQEERARAIHKQLRCLVCQNQSIDDSNAPLAVDLRHLVRERIGQGDSDAETVAYVVARYGDWVLLNPPFKLTTLALWIGPFVLLLVAVVGVRIWYRRQSRESGDTEGLSADERRRLDALLKDSEAS